MNQYSSRREKIYKTMRANCAIMLFSGKAPMRSEDETYDFSVNRNFYYLTGLDAENMVLLISYVDGTYNETLFILPYDKKQAKWVGGRVLPEITPIDSGVCDATWPIDSPLVITFIFLLLHISSAILYIILLIIVMQ